MTDTAREVLAELEQLARTNELEAALAGHLLPKADITGYAVAAVRRWRRALDRVDVAEVERRLGRERAAALGRRMLEAAGEMEAALTRALV